MQEEIQEDKNEIPQAISKIDRQSSQKQVKEKIDANQELLLQKRIS